MIPHKQKEQNVKSPKVFLTSITDYTMIKEMETKRGAAAFF